MTRLLIAILVILLGAMFIFVSSGYPSQEEIQKGEDMKIQTTEPNPIPSDWRTIND